MEKSTLDHIKLLTSLDTKTIGERVMKLFEEGGDATFLNEDKAMLFMRYIRKHTEMIAQAKAVVV